jgi:hypothetical protein
MILCAGTVKRLTATHNQSDTTRASLAATADLAATTATGALAATAAAAVPGDWTLIRLKPWHSC